MYEHRLLLVDPASATFAIAGPASPEPARPRLRARAIGARLAAAALLLATACTAGSGTPGADARELTEFDRLDIGGSFDVHVALGSAARVEITGDDNVVAKVISEVRGRTLHIDLPGRVVTDLPLHVELTTPSLEELDVSGACTILVDGMSGETFELDVSGASTVTLAGELGALDAEISGASTLRAAGLRTTEAEVESSGASKVEVRASDALDAKASGASSIRYYGTPARIARDSSGSSTIAAGD